MDNELKQRRFKVEKCGVCNHVFDEQADYLECPKCHMRYDCIEGKSDNSDVIISPMNCNHRNCLFVQGARDSNGENENVTICADCGEMVITGQTVKENGFFRVRVILPSDELVTAIGRWARLLKAD